MRRAIWTFVGLMAITGVAFTLVGVIIARSPYTHANLSPEGFGRTDVAVVGEEVPYEGIGLADPQLARTGDPIQDGRALFFQYGCRSCHGFRGTGAVVGDDLEDASLSEIRREVRDGPKGMPAFPESVLSDEDLESIAAFIRSDVEETTNTGDEAEEQGEDPLPEATGLSGWIQDVLVALGDSTQREGG